MPSTRSAAFLAEARAQMLGFAELGLRLIELHQPLDAGAVTSDPSAPILRCRSCMWRWPGPASRTLAEVLDGNRGRSGPVDYSRGNLLLHDRSGSGSWLRSLPAWQVGIFPGIVRITDWVMS
jgi:hypothetical protein